MPHLLSTMAPQITPHRPSCSARTSFFVSPEHCLPLPKKRISRLLGASFVHIFDENFYLPSSLAQVSCSFLGLSHFRGSSLKLRAWRAFRPELKSTFKVKSRSLSVFRKNPSYFTCAPSFNDNNFLCAPMLSLFLLMGGSNGGVRWRSIAATKDIEDAITEASISESVATENKTSDRFSSASDQSQVKVKEEVSPQTPKPMPKKTPLTAREKLRAARVLSKYAESKPGKPAMGIKVLDALRETDKNKMRSGLPEAPINMFDDKNRGLEKEGWKFQLPGGSDLFFIAFSFVFISTVMFATTYVVWKVGAIHFNEY